jgi:16S rRNA (guanine(966)-N(2))-methyltransferase RsmD
MRIVGGTYKGRIVNPGKNFKSRPTTDIAKEGLFNILENRYDFSDKSVLDLFAGSGSIGFEFISRGCRDLILVEKDFIHHRFITEVLKNLKIENARAFKTDAFQFIQRFQADFDIIFADPPFDLKNFIEVPDSVLNSGLLKPGGLFILEHPKEYAFSGHRFFSENRKYGKVNFTFFEK